MGSYSIEFKLNLQTKDGGRYEAFVTYVLLKYDNDWSINWETKFNIVENDNFYNCITVVKKGNLLLQW